MKREGLFLSFVNRNNNSLLEDCGNLLASKYMVEELA